MPPALVRGILNGIMLEGKYNLVRLLGEGGMGAVYEAEHLGLGIKVAIKLLNEIYATDSHAVTRFRREARAAALIRHPNVVEVFDTDTTEHGVPYLVMELLEGENLSSVLRQNRLLRPGVAAIITGQVLCGLSAAHDRGIIHRDLKPSNIFLCRLADGSHQIKILDFGISKFFTDFPNPDLTATGALVGTPRFMAPEQAKGQTDIDARIDIYSLGVLLYRMTTGRLPFSAQNQEELIELILEGSPIKPRDINAEIPPELETIIQKSMALDREDRYPDARSFFQALQQAMPDVIGGGTFQITALSNISLTGTPELLRQPGLMTASTHRGTPMRTTGLHEQSTQSAKSADLEIKQEKRRLYILIWSMIILLGITLSIMGYLGIKHYFVGKAARQLISSPKGPKVRFGITRYLPEKQVAREQSALIQYLSQRIERPVELMIFEDYEDLAERLGSGAVDIAALSPYAYVQAKRKVSGIELLATHVTAGRASYEGYIVTKADSNIDVIQDLKNKVFCYVGPNSSSGYLYPRAIFRRYGIDPDISFRATRFTGDHMSALKALESGACAGAAVFSTIFFEAKKYGIVPQKYKILASTSSIPYDAYCAAPTISASLARSLREALLALKPDSELANKILGEASLISGFSPTQDADYDSVRRIEKFLDAPTSNTMKR